MSIQQFSDHRIAHLFVLMLENRSFDHMLGFAGLQGTDAVTGKATQALSLTGTESNNYLGQNYPVIKGADFVMPFDPGHEFGDVLQQLCGDTAIYQPGRDYPTITNSGFVSNFATTRSPGEGGADANFAEILHSYDALREIPVLTTLASEFAICDHWFSSLPGQPGQIDFLSMPRLPRDWTTAPLPRKSLPGRALTDLNFRMVRFMICSTAAGYRGEFIGACAVL